MALLPPPRELGRAPWPCPLRLELAAAASPSAAAAPPSARAMAALLELRLASLVAARRTAAALRPAAPSPHSGRVVGMAHGPRAMSCVPFILVPLGCKLTVAQLL